MIETLVHAVGDRAVVEQRGEYLVDCREHGLDAAHVQQGLLLAGERSLGQVFGGGRRAHGNGDLVAIAHAFQRLDDRGLELGRQWCFDHPLADLRAGPGELIDVVHVEPVQRGVDPLVQLLLAHKRTVGIGRGGEAIRHVHAQLRQRAQHLAQRGILAAYAGHVFAAHVAQWDNVFRHERHQIMQQPSLLHPTVRAPTRKVNDPGRLVGITNR